MRKDLIVPVKKLKRELDFSMLDAHIANEDELTKEIIGQKRAVKAIDFGLSIKKRGYNIYVSGLPGTGKNSYSYFVAKKFAEERETPDDWCYVFNFNKPENPKAIRLKAGDGCYFKKELESIISKLKTELPKGFSSKEYDDRKSVIYLQYEKRVKSIIEELNNISKEYGFVFSQTENGLMTIPLIDNRPMKEEELDELSDEDIDLLKENSSKLVSKCFHIIKNIKKLDTKLKNKIRQLNEKIAFDIVQIHLSPLIEKFNNNEEIKLHLIEMRKDIVNHVDEFVERISSEAGLTLFKAKKDNEFIKRYHVNLFIDNCSKKGAPVIRETNPTYYNLLGKIEYINEMGSLKTDHTRIKPGAIHESNGGYLIIQAKDILNSYSAWEGFKRALSEGEIKIENINKGDIVASTIKPESIPIDIKVILIGDNATYQILYAFDEDFRKLFRIKADFDTEMERNDGNIKKLAQFIAIHCNEEKLKRFDEEAVAKIVEYSSRLADNQNKLTARFNQIVELIYEADAWAEAEGHEVVSGSDVKRAIKEKVYRNNKYEEKLHVLFERENLLIDTFGWKIGEINGLAVMDSGQYTFGRPSKITASTYIGKDGIINIEREAQQSGSSHDKGVLILSGYLGQKYAQYKPLSLSASITFEQSYSIIDGDSASSTELYALISNLSDLPINQAIAVTGSVNQKGIIQPIGGVNEKIEGYFRVCKHKGLKKGAGVIIPHQNIDNLMLDDEIIDAVKNGKFTIYAIKTVDEGIEILTGVPAGERDKNGKYPIGTVNYLVQNKLDSYANFNKDYE